MEYSATVSLKDGRRCLLRSAGPEDAERALEQMVRVMGETDYLSRYPDEITMTVEEEAGFLMGMAGDPRSLMLLAFVEEKHEDGLKDSLAGSALLYPVSPYERQRHRAAFGVTILRVWWGLGIGTALLSAVIGAAREAGYQQIELAVTASNGRAVALYKRFGFTVYGVRERAFLYRDGRYADELLMSLRL